MIYSRALFNPSFHKQVLNSFIDEFNNKGDLLLEKLRSMADGKTQVVMLDEFNHATLDAIATVYIINFINYNNNNKIYFSFILEKIAFGMESNTLNDPTNKLNKYVTESFRGFFKMMTSKASDVQFDIID